MCIRVGGDVMHMTNGKLLANKQVLLTTLINLSWEEKPVESLVTGGVQSAFSTDNESRHESHMTQAMPLQLAQHHEHRE